ISHSIKWYVQIGFDLVEGKDIVEVTKGLARTSLAQITINRNDRNSRSEIEDLVESELAKFIRAKGLPNIGSWKNFSPAEIDKLSNFPITHPKPIVSAYTKLISDWTIPIPKIQVSTSNSIIKDMLMEGKFGNDHQDIE
ncbi:51_t:CDS:2, partial [Scutellospora calospora]